MSETSSRSTRRAFMQNSTLAVVGTALGTVAGASVAAEPAEPTSQPEPAKADDKPIGRKIKLGFIGCGGRGSWLGKLFAQHGGYEIAAVADYFPDLADRNGDALGVAKDRRYSGLDGYKRLLASGVEAVVVVNVPRFHAEHAHAAVEAGCHVFAAKPVAVDVPRAMKVLEAGKLATEKKLCYLVDYQMPTDPINIEVVRRVHEGGLGRLMHVDSVGFSPPWAERPVANPEERLRGGRWLTTTALSGDVITENTIHSINAVLWLVGKRPTAAIGRTAIARQEPKEDFREVYLVTYEFDDGAIWTHRCQSLRNQLDWDLHLMAYGDVATALVGYRDRAYLRGGPKHYGGGKIVSLYDQGAIRNIATFYRNVVDGHFDNPTVPQAVDDALTATLGREAATRRCCLTMEELIKENKELPFDLSGFKV